MSLKGRALVQYGAVDELAASHDPLVTGDAESHLRLYDDSGYERLPEERRGELSDQAWHNLHNEKLYCTCCGTCTKCACRTRTRCVCTTLALVLLVLGTLAIVAWYVFIPYQVQSIVDRSTLEFTSTSLLSPTGDDAQFESHGYMTNAARYNVHMHAATLQLQYIGEYCNVTNHQVCDVGSIQAIPFDINGADTSSPVIAMKGKLHVTHTAGFNALGNSLSHSKYTTWHLKGRVTLTIHAFGLHITVPHITLDKSIHMRAFDGLKNVTMNVFEVNMTPSNELGVSILTSVRNPSVVAMLPMGRLSFDMYYDDVLLGTLSMPSTNLTQGENEFAFSGILHPAKLSALDAVMTNYLTGQSTYLVAHGASHGSSSIPLYAPIFSNLSLTTSLRPVAHGLAVQATIDLTWEILWDFILYDVVVLPTQLLMHNPFNASVHFEKLHLDVVYNDTVVATSYTDTGSDGKPLHFNLPGNATVWGEPLPVTLDSRNRTNFKEAMIAMLKSALDGIVLLGIQGTMDAMVGTLPIHSGYYQPIEVPTCTSTNKTLCDDYVKEHPTWGF
jgi:Protein of unknown function (DUF3712)